MLEVGMILAIGGIMISIRKAEPSDIPSLATLLGMLFDQEAEFAADVELQTQGLEMIISNPSVGELLIGQRTDGSVVGMVSLLYTVSTALGGRVALLEDMVVEKERAD